MFGWLKKLLRTGGDEPTVDEVVSTKSTKKVAKKPVKAKTAPGQKMKCNHCGKLVNALAYKKFHGPKCKG